MSNHLSKVSIAFLGFVSGVAFLMSCGGGGSSSANAADTTTTKIPYVVDGADVTIGKILDIENNINIKFITESGYFASVATSGDLTGISEPLYYTSADCTGQAFVSSIYINGSLFGANGIFRYIPLDANEELGFQSSSQGNIEGTSCTAQFKTQDLVRTSPNDVSVTGIPNTGYTGRVSVSLL